MKNIKKTLFALLLATAITSSITTTLIISDSDIQTQFLCEETEIDYNIILCHDDKGRGANG